MKWVAIYFKPSKNWEDDPMDVTYHGFEAEAESAESAVETLETSPETPWQTYLVEVVSKDSLPKWEQENGVKVDSPPINFLY